MAAKEEHDLTTLLSLSHHIWFEKGGKAKLPSDDGKKFEFISVSGDDPRGDAATRRRVRSHAQADYRRRHPQPPVQPLRPAMTFELDVSAFANPALNPEVGGSDSLPSSSRTQLTSSSSSEPEGLAFGPVSPREVMREDAFGLRPGSRTKRSQLLWDHLYDGTCVVFKSMLHIGFIDIVRESTALTQMLSASAWHLEDQSHAGDVVNASESSGGGAMAVCLEGDTGSDYARYSVAASRSLREKLQKPETKASMEVVIAVLAFAAYGALSRDPRLIQIHLDGLSHVLGHRGGLPSVESMPVVRLMIYWVDLTGAYFQDTVPRFAQPYEIIAMRSKMLLVSEPIDRSSRPGPDLALDPSVYRVCHLLRQLSGIIDRESLVRGDVFWQDVLFCPFHISPILHDCLSFLRFSGDGEHDVYAQRREFFRLAAILYMTEIRKRFAIDDTAAIVYATKMRMMLDTVVGEQTRSWEESNHFLIWSLVVASACSSVHEALRVEFLDRLVARIKAAGIASFSELSGLVSGLTWCEAALGHTLADLEKQLPADLF